MGKGGLLHVEEGDELAHADLARVLAQDVHERQPDGVAEGLGDLGHALGVGAVDIVTRTLTLPIDGALYETTEMEFISPPGKTLAVVGEGHGPVNALDVALRAALKLAYPHVDDFELIDYRVRILDQGHGTDAIVRTLIDTTDGERTWTTVGVGTNVIEASWEALYDAYRWGLTKRAVPVG